MTYSVLDDIVLVFDDEDHVKSRENSRHEVNVLLGGCVREEGEKYIERERGEKETDCFSFSVIPSSKNGISSCQY